MRSRRGHRRDYAWQSVVDATASVPGGGICVVTRCRVIRGFDAKARSKAAPAFEASSARQSAPAAGRPGGSRSPDGGCSAYATGATSRALSRARCATGYRRCPPAWSATPALGCGRSRCSPRAHRQHRHPPDTRQPAPRPKAGTTRSVTSFDRPWNHWGPPKAASAI